MFRLFKDVDGELKFQQVPSQNRSEEHIMQHLKPSEMIYNKPGVQNYRSWQQDNAHHVEDIADAIVHRILQVNEGVCKVSIDKDQLIDILSKKTYGSSSNRFKNLSSMFS